MPHPYDGIGATVKRSIWRAVKTDKNHISDVSEYASLVKEQDSNINIEFISSNEIENTIFKLNLGERSGCSMCIKTSLC